jgi:hypothetical protein
MTYSPDLPQPVDSPSATPAARRSRLERIATWAIPLVFFAVCLGVYSRKNAFPYYYHYDEPRKTEQIIEHWRNFNHPLLLLTATDLATEIVRQEDTRQQVVVVGRWVSATFSAAAIAVLALLAIHYYGFLAGICAGALAGCSPNLLRYAHYMKEDPALVMGIAIFLLALAIFQSRRTNGSLIFLGIGVAVAASGKYMGLVAIPIALPFVFAAAPRGDPEQRKRWFKTFFWAAGITLLIINYQIVLHLADFYHSFRKEIKHSVTEHAGLTRDVPHLAYWKSFINHTTWPIWALIAAQLGYMLITVRRRNITEWIVFLFPVGFAVVMSFATLVNTRYLLPVFVLAGYLAGVGAANLTRIIPARRSAGWAARTVLAAGLVGVALWYQGPHFLKEYNGFRHDYRAELVEWIETNLPADAVIAQDDYVNLPDPDVKKHADATHYLDRELRSTKFVADLGSLEDLRAAGITHVAVCRMRFGRVFSKTRHPIDEVVDDFERRRRIYQRLFDEGKLLWETKRGTILTLQPELRLYDITHIEPAPPNDPAAAAPAVDQ